jgi:GNAT superfamily N-acetyltransferase
VGQIAVERVEPRHWDDVADLFTRKGPRGGTPQTDGCWCRFWLVRGKAYWDGHGSGHRRALREEIRGGDASALLAYVDGKAVGWCRLGPRETFERLEHSAKLTRVDDQHVWSIVCFYVDPTAKRQGVATALLDAALDHVRAQGVRLVEAYPVREGHMNIDAYTGYLPMFLDAGFDVVRDAGRRLVVRRGLRPSRRGSTRSRTGA